MKHHSIVKKKLWNLQVDHQKKLKQSLIGCRKKCIVCQSVTGNKSQYLSVCQEENPEIQLVQENIAKFK